MRALRAHTSTHTRTRTQPQRVCMLNLKRQSGVRAHSIAHASAVTMVVRIAKSTASAHHVSMSMCGMARARVGMASSSMCNANSVKRRAGVDEMSRACLFDKQAWRGVRASEHSKSNCLYATLSCDASHRRFDTNRPYGWRTGVREMSVSIPL